MVSFTLHAPSVNVPLALFAQVAWLVVFVQAPVELVKVPVVLKLFVPATVAIHVPQASQLNCTAPEALLQLPVPLHVHVFVDKGLTEQAPVGAFAPPPVATKVPVFLVNEIELTTLKLQLQVLVDEVHEQACVDGVLTGNKPLKLPCVH